jgi:ABC-type dipeptide/oligopeptide/nickel transport system permease subunit
VSDTRAVEVLAAPQDVEASAGPRRGRATARRILGQRSAQVGLVILGFLVTVALLADVIAPYHPNLAIGIAEGARPRAAPCIHLLGCPEDRPQFILGLDGNARDLLSRIVHGARISLLIGFTTVGGAIVIGTLIGSVAGFIGGRVDSLLMRLMDMVLAFPALVLALVIVTVLGRSLVNAMIAVAIVAIPIYARVMRASVLSVREQDYVTAARALGDSQLSILRRRVLPNAITPLIVQGTLGIGTAILEIAALSFLGLAAAESASLRAELIYQNTEWGLIIGRERAQLFSAPHLIFFPGLMLTLTVLAFNLLGDGLRDAFDPRLSR